MATQEYAASIQGVSIRVTRLDASGNLLNGPGDSYTTSAFMRVSFTPEYEEGDEITEKSANGTVCVTYKAPDTLKRITMELAICEPDPELTALISGGLLLRKNVNGVVKSVGWAAPGVGDDPAGFGVAIESWSHAVKDGKRASVLPYFHWVFPYAKLRQSGDRVIENGMLATTFEGYGLGNINFSSGPDKRWEYPIAAERPYSYARTNWAPQGLQGFYTWDSELTASINNKVLANNVVTLTTSAAHGITANDTVVVSHVTNPSFSVSNKALAANIATLTTSAAHGIAVGTSIVVSGVDSTFNGTYTTTSGTTGSTIKFAKTGDDVVEASATGSVVESADIFNGTFTVVGVPSDTTFTYAKTHANVATAAQSPVGTATVSNPINEPGAGASYTAVTTEELGAGGSTYNVPGNISFNADESVDRIIQSNEDAVS